MTQDGEQHEEFLNAIITHLVEHHEGIADEDEAELDAFVFVIMPLGPDRWHRTVHARHMPQAQPHSHPDVAFAWPSTQDTAGVTADFNRLVQMARRCGIANTEQAISDFQLLLQSEESPQVQPVVMESVFAAVAHLKEWIQQIKIAVIPSN